MKAGDITTVLTVAGEFVGKLKEIDGNKVTLTDPKMLIQTQTGMGFARGVCVTGKENVEEVQFMGVVLVTPTNEEIESAWRQATTGIVTAV